MLLFPAHERRARDRATATHFVEAAGRRLDSSMAEIPHEYTVRGQPTAGRNLPSAEAHEWFAGQIREHGHRDRFERWSYVYLELDGWKYWAVGNVVSRERLTAPED